MSGGDTSALENAMRAFVRANYGEDLSILHGMAMILVEKPPAPNEKPHPSDKRAQMVMVTLGPIKQHTAAQMLREAAIQLQRNGAT